jgi:hypothetical protein
MSPGRPLWRLPPDLRTDSARKTIHQEDLWENESALRMYNTVFWKASGAFTLRFAVRRALGALHKT